MNKHDRHINTLLKRWISGDITARDEAALWEAAQHDDLLRDALQGYARHADTNHEQALERLQRRTSEAPVRWWRPAWGVAAALACLMVAAWWISSPDNPSTDAVSAIATHTTEAQALEADASEASALDTSPPIADANPQRTTPPASILPRPAATAPTLAADDTVIEETPLLGKVAPAEAAQTGAPADFGYAPPAASTAPATAMPSAPPPPAEADAVEEAEAYTLEQARKKEAPLSRTSAASYMDAAAQNAYPANGLAAFNSYVARNSPPRSQGQWVTLRFDLDANDQPIRIEVVDASRKSLQAKAVEILQNGGRWQWVPGAPREGVVYRMVF